MWPQMSTVDEESYKRFVGCLHASRSRGRKKANHHDRLMWYQVSLQLHRMVGCRLPKLANESGGGGFASSLRSKNTGWITRAVDLAANTHVLRSSSYSKLTEKMPPTNTQLAHNQKRSTRRPSAEPLQRRAGVWAGVECETSRSLYVCLQIGQRAQGVEDIIHDFEC
jgi:hypothetical protein